MEPTVSITKNIEIKVPVSQLANFFWMLSPEQKIEYFNELAKQTEEWFGGLEYCEAEIKEFINRPELTDGAIYILKLLCNT